MAIIVLKHLAREFNLSPFRVRTLLRASKVKPSSNGRWEWDDTQPKSCASLTAARKFLKGRRNGKHQQAR